ncbi:MAG: peptidase T, partial [Vibrio metschnikovii]
MQNLVERFLRYVTYDTQSKPKNTHTPSSSEQLVFAQHLVEELQQIGLSEASVDEYGYVMACLPSNVQYTVPAIGFIAHLDTAPDASGKHVKPQIVEHYQGGDIALGKGDEILSPIQYPELHQLHGDHLITTDGHTLLGADNKAGIAEIITAIEMLIADPSIPHGDIY